MPEKLKPRPHRPVQDIRVGLFLAPVSVNGNVPNYDLIDNLPYGCCVEVPYLVNGAGLQPTRVGGFSRRDARPAHLGGVYAYL